MKMINLREIFYFVSIVFVVSNLNSVNGQQHYYLDKFKLNELYRFIEDPGNDDASQLFTLGRGDSETASIHLNKSIHFYSEKYDLIFINTNGILTFGREFTEYLNQPFPLEYPSIAPFYSNVDTSNGNASTVISLFKTKNPEQLEKVQNIVRSSFLNKNDFEANGLVVATWENVGYYDSKTDKLNTFQVAIIFNDNETYVQFVYPEGGLNWLQGEGGENGLPDIRAQAGFVAEDGRYFNIDGSGSDNVRYLNAMSNIDVAGVWLFNVGPLDYGENVHLPNSDESFTAETPIVQMTCAEGGYKKCHSSANCVDKIVGFCCVCREGFYGNGYTCIRNTVPIRVSGSLSGEINGETIDNRAKLQSYVVMADGRSYTAINPLDIELGAKLRLALPIVSTIGWLFAKPMHDARNGYQLTGGEFIHMSKLSFESGEVLRINQTFEGLNYWDQLTVQVDVFGEVPLIPHTAKLHMSDYIDEYKFVAAGELRSVHAHHIEIPSQNSAIAFQLDQTIHFERCQLDNEVDPSGTTVLQKVSKVALDYFEKDQALRTGLLVKIGVDAESNQCNDGTANCGENTLCVPEDDSYTCVCLNGYAPELSESGAERCADIDECSIGTHICDDNAFCTNNDGGYECMCNDGYTGNGYECEHFGSKMVYDVRETTAASIAVIVSTTAVGNTVTDDGDEGVENGEANRNTLEQEEVMSSRDNHVDECGHCSTDADCVESHCECRQGFYGDGYSCSYSCGQDDVFLNGKCMPIDEYEQEPVCNMFGDCTCPDGFELMVEENVCRLGQSYDTDTKPEEAPCDVEDNCHQNATCEWSESEMKHACQCNRGFLGNGHTCALIDETCSTRPGICDNHATCRYNDSLGKSVCQCDRGYEGDGFRCQLAPDCRLQEDCGQNSICDNGICQCSEGFERDLSDFCVPVGRCGGTYCADNAVCKWDAIQSVQFCECMEGYIGDPLSGCKSIPIPCNVRNNCGVQATCQASALDVSKYVCLCNRGFYGDGYVCIEEQNCENTPAMCDPNASCVSTNSGPICVCNQGFLGNGTLCRERPQYESGFLLVSQGVVIIRVPLNGKFARPISVASMAIGLDKDCVEGRVYWGDISAKKIMSAKYDGTDTRPFITDDIESPEGIAIDSISRRLYWTDSVKDTIEVASLDDSTLRTILINKHLVNPRGIVVDPYREKLYWSDWNRESPKIEMSDLDGTGREILLASPSVILPNSLVVIDGSGEICYADAGTKKIECIDSYSKQVRTIANDLHYPFGLTTTNQLFYWTDWTTKKLESVDHQGVRQKGMQTPFFGSHKMYGMTAVEDSCPMIQSPCQIHNGGCADSRICLSNRKAPSGKSCKCTKLSKLCHATYHEDYNPDLLN